MALGGAGAGKGFELALRRLWLQSKVLKECSFLGLCAPCGLPGPCKQLQRLLPAPKGCKGAQEQLEQELEALLEKSGLSTRVLQSQAGGTECPAMLHTWLTVPMEGAEVLTGVELEEQLDGVVVEVAAVQDHLDERSQAALPCRSDRHRA